jgi:plastocyanin
MKKQSLFLLILVVSVAVVLVGCASATPEPVSYTIDMTEYAFTPDRLEAKVGQQVTLNLVNKGQLAHEIMFGRNVMMMDGRPSGYEQDMFMEAGVEPEVMVMEAEHEEGEDHDEEAGHEEGEEHGHEGFMVLLNKTDDQATMTFTVTEDMVGEWEIGCFELDGVHYDAGMKGVFVVTR